MQLHKSWVLVVPAIFAISFQALSQDAQEAAIRKTIADQNAALIKHDAEAWKATWLQDENTFTSFTNYFGSTVKHGWQNASAELLKMFQQNPNPDSITLETDSFYIRREGNMAVVDYKQEMKTTTPAPFNKFTMREQRVLVKKNGKWLVAGATSTDITNLDDNGPELTVNAIGYNYLFAGKTDEAIKVLELNTVLFPNSFNVWDSLGEAYAKAGNKEKARECYEKSLAIYPDNNSGKKALSDLK